MGTGIAWVLWPGAPQLPDYDWQQTATSDYQPGGSACDPTSIDRLRADRKGTRKREACEDAAEQHRLQTNDLIQQTRAANAATEAVWIAEWQSKATVFGLIVGLYTLAAAAAAAIFAKQAADAATRTLEHEVLVSGLQLNAVLHIESVDIIGARDSDRMYVSVEVHNVGTLPAKKLKVIGAWGFRGDLETTPLRLRPCTVPMGLSQGTVHHVRLPAAEPSDAPREGSLFCQFEIVWENRDEEKRGFGEVHRSDGGDFSLAGDYQLYGAQ